MIRGVWGEGPTVEKKETEMIDSEKEPEVPKINPKTKQKHKGKFIRWWSNWPSLKSDKERKKEMRKAMKNSPTID